MEEDGEAPSHPTICFLGNYPPKECGIATFTKDLSSAMNRKFGFEFKSKIIALNDDANIYNYDQNVIQEINKDDIDDYISKAKEINDDENIKLICIQHEFGIFGGEYGNHLIPFLDLIEKPIVVVFHSILPTPNTAIKRIVKSLCEKSSVVVVMAKKAIEKGLKTKPYVKTSFTPGSRAVAEYLKSLFCPLPAFPVWMVLTEEHGNNFLVANSGCLN